MKEDMFAMIVKSRMEEKERASYCGVQEVGGFHHACVSGRYAIC